MQVWGVVFHADSFTDNLFEQGLALVDGSSQARIKRFYRREDACRVLLGRLLPRVLLQKRGINLRDVVIGQTDAGKPFIISPILQDRIGFNISHDNSLIAMAYQIESEEKEPEADPLKIGIDIMKVALPRYEQSFETFVHNLGDTLTPLERRLLEDPSALLTEKLRRIYLMWTLKEAYTKAIGYGLGFAFNRIECNVLENTVLIDGAAPRGWEFVVFSVNVQGHEVDKQELYLGVVARFIGGDEVLRMAFRDHDEGSWFLQYDAPSIVRFALEGNN
ncbi:hypothetical protein BD410DRAFT_823497 [Rickenella mellea]|uniref:holo-[acyl-carrier-protein] synthase n=1 Tax=Rickenella mellea TaxID=50990 RepID=A0A4R5XEZ6_9AGAM|nr:hypothetical protein BD410DRAFT_823497 [Rickenella mellea]